MHNRNHRLLGKNLPCFWEVPSRVGKERNEDEETRRPVENGDELAEKKSRASGRGTGHLEKKGVGLARAPTLFWVPLCLGRETTFASTGWLAGALGHSGEHSAEREGFAAGGAKVCSLQTGCMGMEGLHTAAKLQRRIGK
jgi:hypothetical protein